MRQEKPDSIMIHLRRMTGHDEFLSASILRLYAPSNLDASIVSLMTGDQRDLSVGRRLNVMFEQRRYRVVRFVVVAAIDAHRFSALRSSVERNTLVGACNFSVRFLRSLIYRIFVRSICISRSGSAKHRRRSRVTRRQFARALTTIHQVARGSNSKALARATLRNFLSIRSSRFSLNTRYRIFLLVRCTRFFSSSSIFQLPFFLLYFRYNRSKYILAKRSSISSPTILYATIGSTKRNQREYHQTIGGFGNANR